MEAMDSMELWGHAAEQILHCVQDDTLERAGSMGQGGVPQNGSFTMVLCM